jgi:hypothetical protein
MLGVGNGIGRANDGKLLLSARFNGVGLRVEFVGKLIQPFNRKRVADHGFCEASALDGFRTKIIGTFHSRTNPTKG